MDQSSLKEISKQMEVEVSTPVDLVAGLSSICIHLLSIRQWLTLRVK
jgi:hypothetical protein